MDDADCPISSTCTPACSRTLTTTRSLAMTSTTRPPAVESLDVPCL
jgi:hypothetical protein